MIILRHVPFEKRAQFLVDNVCAYSQDPEFAAALGEHTADVAAGLKAYQEMLRDIYADVEWIEGKSDRARYLEIIGTMSYLYAFLAFGTLVQKNDRSSVLIDKAVLNQRYKKGSLAKRKRHLERHGFTIRYLAGDTECASLSKATQLSMSIDRASLLPAAKFFADSIESLFAGPVAPNSILDKRGIFIKGEYDAAILKESISRNTLDPLRTDILRTVGDYESYWRALVGVLRDNCKLDCSGFFHYGASPSWGVSFAQKRKKPLAIFTLGSHIVFIEFTLPVDAAERIILNRQHYSSLIREKIESFHCVKCPKKCKGANMVKIDGVSLCTGRAEARRIYATLATPHDFESILSMLDTICG